MTKVIAISLVYYFFGDTVYTVHNELRKKLDEVVRYGRSVIQGY